MAAAAVAYSPSRQSPEPTNSTARCSSSFATARWTRTTTSRTPATARSASSSETNTAAASVDPRFQDYTEEQDILLHCVRISRPAIGRQQFLHASHRSPDAGRLLADVERARPAARRSSIPSPPAPDPARPGQFLRTPFRGNRIPANRLDPVALNAQKYYGPRPNLPGLAFTGQNNFFFQGKFKADINRGTAKVDHQLQRETEALRSLHHLRQSERPAHRVGLARLPGRRLLRQRRAAAERSGGLHQHLSSNSILNLRYGFARSILNRQSNYLGFKPTSAWASRERRDRAPTSSPSPSSPSRR